MIPKAELKHKIADLEERLAQQTLLIKRYFPFADDLVDLVDTLTRMGLEYRTRELLMVGQLYEMESLIDPATGKKYAAHYVKVSIAKNPETEHYEVYIDGMTTADFFSRELTNKEDLDLLAAQNPKVKELWEENERLRHILKLDRR